MTEKVRCIAGEDLRYTGNIIDDLVCIGDDGKIYKNTGDIIEGLGVLLHDVIKDEKVDILISGHAIEVLAIKDDGE